MISVSLVTISRKWDIEMGVESGLESEESSERVVCKVLQETPLPPL